MQTDRVLALKSTEELFHKGQRKRDPGDYSILMTFARGHTLHACVVGDDGRWPVVCRDGIDVWEREPVRDGVPFTTERYRFTPTRGEYSGEVILEVMCDAEWQYRIFVEKAELIENAKVLLHEPKDRQHDRALVCDGASA